MDLKRREMLLTAVSIGMSEEEVPSKPLEPDNPIVSWMGAKDGPFHCSNCNFYNGPGEKCRWVNRGLQDGDCCNKYDPKPKGERIG